MIKTNKKSENNFDLREKSNNNSDILVTNSKKDKINNDLHEHLESKKEKPTYKYVCENGVCKRILYN